MYVGPKIASHLFRGVDLEKLLDLGNEEFMQMVHARARRRMMRGLTRKVSRGYLCELNLCRYLKLNRISTLLLLHSNELDLPTCCSTIHTAYGTY